MNAVNIWTRLRHALGNYPVTARDWAVRARSQDVSRRELLALDDWLRADPRNAEDYARVSKIAHLGLLLRDVPESRARLRRMPPPAGAPSLSARWSPAGYMATAAAIVMAVALGALLYLPWESSEQYASRRGEQRQVALSDGSRMTVNTDSATAVRFTPSERGIELVRGEAFFDVVKELSRPFVVRTPTADVYAIGTRFSVRHDELGTRVVVSEGRVRLAARPGEGVDAAPAAVLAANSQGTLVRGSAPQLAAVDAERATAWVTGNVEFEETPLADVLADVNRYTRKPFILDDASLADIRLTGRFRVGDTESVKFVLAGRFGVRASEDGSTIRLSR